MLKTVVQGILQTTLSKFVSALDHAANHATLVEEIQGLHSERNMM